MFFRYVILGLIIGAAGHLAEPEGTDPAVNDFNHRVQRYWEIHKKSDAAAPPIDKKEGADPNAILAHEQALAGGIRAARSSAAEGDIFTPAVRKVFTQIIQQELSSGAGAAARDLILGEGNPRNPASKADVRLSVNAKYPSDAPVSTMPPSLLSKLPKLPEGLEYRFVGRHLILYDSSANLIVDIFRNAVR